MKILFFPSSCLPFHAKTLEERPLGGTETAAIRLSAALQKLGHDVSVITPLENPPLSVPLYLPLRALGDISSVDVLIAIREWHPLLLNINTKVRCCWFGDSYDQPHNFGISDKRVLKYIDWLLPVSNWHAQRLCEESGFPTEKVHVLRNGIQLAEFEKSETRAEKRLIYSSTPYRGLEHLPAIFEDLRKIHPTIELHVFSAYQVYADQQGKYNQNAELEYHLLVKRLNALEGCIVHGNVKQQQLATEFLKSTILAYPNHFEETSCITAIEAQAAGCPIVTTDLGALSETVGDAGILIPPPAGTIQYQQSFVAAVNQILSEPALFSQLSHNGRNRAKQYDWDIIAREFAGFLQEVITTRV